MTKDEALAFDLALEALRPFSTPNWAGTGVDKANEAITAITAIKQARSAPVQEPAEVLGHNGWGFPIKAAAPVQKKCDCAAHSAADCVCGAWDKSAVAPVQEDWGPGPHEYHSLTASVQEPVAWRYRGILHEFDPSDWAEGPVTPLYTTPPAQPAPVQERNFCERCGKRLGSGIHTCTPPAAPVQEPDEWLTGCPECGMDSGCDCDSGTWNPPAAQRQWVRLTNEEIAQIYLVNTDKPLKADWLFARAIERKLKEKNT